MRVRHSMPTTYVQVVQLAIFCMWLSQVPTASSCTPGPATPAGPRKRTSAAAPASSHIGKGSVKRKVEVGTSRTGGGGSSGARNCAGVGPGSRDLGSDDDGHDRPRQRQRPSVVEDLDNASDDSSEPCGRKADVNRAETTMTVYCARATAIPSKRDQTSLGVIILTLGECSNEDCRVRWSVKWSYLSDASKSKCEFCSPACMKSVMAKSPKRWCRPNSGAGTGTWRGKTVKSSTERGYFVCLPNKSAVPAGGDFMTFAGPINNVRHARSVQQYLREDGAENPAAMHWPSIRGQDSDSPHEAEEEVVSGESE